MLSFKSISFHFGKTPIFENVSLDFDCGKTYGVVGSNGVGKTTLFRSIAGLYKLKSGTILLDNKSVHSTDVAFLPTDPFFYPYMKGREYLNIVHKNPDAIEQSIQKAIALNVPIDNLVDTYSTGMKKKLAFTAQYTQNKSVSIYDEPFNGVDLESNEFMLQLLQQKDPQKITLISSHILGMLYEVCDSIIHIETGFQLSIYSPDQFEELKFKIRSSI